MIRLLLGIAMVVIGMLNLAMAEENKSPHRVMFDDVGERVCRVSMYELIVKPERYDGKLIQVIGYFADGGSIGSG
ncbi:hypothetical protein [Tahibacter soli]|uniref:Uncharacterized protein n=1 Tax=Tahibacter soli TaxID=2983605 RepID=A0A9X4BGC1_9GAMM|nr:hypothetical protein [Tahibacter soli]MDC8012570.1 hypothetical protein [Tahibacter soli]